MNITGLDYNTQRDQLIMPEYGREIQKMVDYAVALPTKQERQICAETIASMMMARAKQTLDVEDLQRAIWDHLYLISRKKLDIDWPYPIDNAEKINTKPEPMPLPGTADGHVRLRHYGRLMEKSFEKLTSMPPGKERDDLTKVIANQMKRDLATWGRGSMDDEKVADDLARYTHGVIQLDLNAFKFDKIHADNGQQPSRKGRKKR